MAVLSPALVVAMSAMFVLTRLHRHFYIFERPLLFGLLYVLEPDPDHLAALDRLTASNGNAKLRPTAASVPLRLTAVGPTFFPEDPQPYHRALSHTLSLLAATLVSALFESALLFLAPSLLANTRTSHLALLTLVFSLVHNVRLSAALVPARLIVAVFAVLMIPSLLLTHAPSAAPLVAFGPPVTLARAELRTFLVSALKLDAADGSADRVAAYLVFAARALLALLAAALASSQAVPARRITLLDAKLRSRFARDDDTLAETPYEPARPPLYAMLLVAVDHALALAVALLPVLTEVGVLSRVALTLLWATVRLCASRARLQAFLFEAGCAYRDFWPERAALGTQKAAENARRTVVGTSHFVFLIAVAYVGPAVAATAAAAAAATGRPVGGFVAEAGTYLAWVAVASYEIFGVLSLATEALFGSAEERKDGKKNAVPTPVSGSERRRQRRIVEARMRDDAKAEAKSR